MATTVTILALTVMAEGGVDQIPQLPEESEVPKQQTETDEQRQEGSTSAKPDSTPRGEEPAADQEEEGDTLVSVWNGLRLYITTWEPTGTPA